MKQEVTEVVASYSRILVADDEAYLLNVIQRVRVKGKRFTALTALGGDAALWLIREKSPDAVLLDLAMPAPDGREVCRNHRSER